MAAIIDFLEGIGDFFVGIGDRITSTVTGTAQMLEMIASFRENLQSYLAWIPDSVYMVIAVGFSVCCLYIVLGRT